MKPTPSSPLETNLDRIEQAGELRDTLRTTLRELADSMRDSRMFMSELKKADKRIAELEKEMKSIYAKLEQEGIELH